jgi:hypothetical protein
MKLFRIFSIGSPKILAKNHCVTGTVTGVRRSYLYVVKKPVRLIPNDQNTMTSHYIFFTYAVNGVPHKGKLWISLRFRCPRKGEQIDVYYDPEKPENYACYGFGPAVRPIGW